MDTYDKMLIFHISYSQVYFPYLLINKKRYAGLYFTKVDTYDKMLIFHISYSQVYFPYLLINKKRYAGLYFTKADTYDKMLITCSHFIFPGILSLPSNQQEALRWSVLHQGGHIWQDVNYLFTFHIPRYTFLTF